MNKTRSLALFKCCLSSFIKINIFQGVIYQGLFFKAFNSNNKNSLRIIGFFVDKTHQRKQLYIIKTILSFGIRLD